jgi:hypothetical protein
MTKPIKPEEIDDKFSSSIPDFVFDIFNKLIVKNYNPNTKSSTVLQKDVIAELIQHDLTKESIFANHYLDVENFYVKAGWRVLYEKPVAYAGENFDAYFKFSK